MRRGVPSHLGENNGATGWGPAEVWYPKWWKWLVPAIEGLLTGLWGQRPFRVGWALPRLGNQQRVSELVRAIDGLLTDRRDQRLLAGWALNLSGYQQLVAASIFAIGGLTKDQWGQRLV